MNQEALIVDTVSASAELPPKLARQWRELCDRGLNPIPFCRPEWIGAYAHNFVPHANLILFTVRTLNELKAVLPMQEELTSFCGLQVRKLRGTTNVHSGRFDLVLAPEENGKCIVQALWDILKNSSTWDVLEFPFVPQGGILEHLLESASADGLLVGRQEAIRSPYIPLADWKGGEDVWPEYVSGRFRKDLRRVTRHLSSQGALQLHRSEKADVQMLERFYALESSGWKGKEGSAIASSPYLRAFYDEFARAAEAFGYLSLYLLELDGTPIAGHFGLAYRRRYFSPKVAYDERYRQYSPGQVLMHMVLRDCVQRGFSEFDILGPWADWKAKWTPLVRPHFHYFVYPKTLKGYALHGASFRAKAIMKRLLGRS